jgi:branched-chain amino acid aminotransferase
MSIYYVDGQFIEADKARISVDDLSVLRGFGVFDFLRTYNGVPFHLAEHLQRLLSSARLIGLRIPHGQAALAEIVKETLTRNNHPESNIRLVITGGASTDGITPGPSPRLLVLITPVKPLPVAWHRDGIKVITCHVERFMPAAKSINYIPAILCQAEARDRQAVEAVYVDRDGYLLEATTSNIFAVRGNRLITPPCDRVLAGVTRQVVLELAHREWLVEERPLHRDEIRLLDEAFLTSSVKELTPVVTIDSVSLGDGQPGQLTRRIMELFRAYTVAYRG